MKTPVLVGSLLLAIGVGAFAYEGVKYTRHAVVIDANGSATGPHERTPPLSPMLGGTALAAGTVLVIIGKRKRPVV